MRILIAAAITVLALFGDVPPPANDGPKLSALMAEWNYPGATDVISSLMVKEPFFMTSFDTSDDPRDVIKRYEQKMQFEVGNRFDQERASRIDGVEMKNGDLYTLVKSASMISHSAEEFIVTKKTKTAVISLVVLRIPKRRLTRVTITHIDLGK